MLTLFTRRVIDDLYDYFERMTKKFGYLFFPVESVSLPCMDPTGRAYSAPADPLSWCGRGITPSRMTMSSSCRTITLLRTGDAPARGILFQVMTSGILVRG